MLKKILPKWTGQHSAALFELTQAGNLKKIKALWGKFDQPFKLRKRPETQIYKRGWSVFEYAVYHGHLELVAWYIEQGADIHARRSINVSTPLGIAAQNKNQEMLGLLVSFGANIDSDIKNYSARSLLKTLHQADYDPAAYLLWKAQQERDGLNHQTVLRPIYDYNLEKKRRL